MRVLVQNVRVHIGRRVQILAHNALVKFVEDEHWQGVDLRFACKRGVLAWRNCLIAELFGKNWFYENIYIE